MQEIRLRITSTDIELTTNNQSEITRSSELGTSKHAKPIGYAAGYLDYAKSIGVASNNDEAVTLMARQGQVEQHFSDTEESHEHYLKVKTELLDAKHDALQELSAQLTADQERFAAQIERAKEIIGLRGLNKNHMEYILNGPASEKPVRATRRNKKASKHS